MKLSFSSVGTRALAGVAFALLLIWSQSLPSPLPAQAVRDWLDAAPDAQTFVNVLSSEYPSAIDPATRAAFRSASREFGQAGSARWTTVSRRSSMAPEKVLADLGLADLATERGAKEVTAAVRGMKSYIDFPSEGDGEVTISRSLELPLRKGVVVAGQVRNPEIGPNFLWSEVDLSAGAEHRIELSAASNLVVGIHLRNAPEGESSHRVEVHSGSLLLATLDLAISTPAWQTLDVKIEGDAAAAVGLYTEDGDLLIPDGAADFSESGYRYYPTRYREHANASYWPGRETFSRCVFVRDGFSIQVPAGKYRLMASRGSEFMPIDRRLVVAAGNDLRESVQLSRWTDMPARGWISGDCHIHHRRADPSANELLFLWAEAEDIHVGNILRMGDGRRSYFEQYAFGPEGRASRYQTALIPGQEDPRTNVLGHTISLNLKSPIRETAGGYYLYGKVFQQSRAQGGLSGYAHVNSDSFLVHRDLTVNAALGNVDFVEICEFGDINTELYYEFLNLGFPLTAVAGSDVPWGGTVGDSRVYAYTGGSFDADDWFQAVREGKTFVTAGPTLEFSVEGVLPGSEIVKNKSQRLKISAKAEVGFSSFELGKLEIVRNGEVIEAAAFTDNRAKAEMDILVTSSGWYAARIKSDARTSAHTTPVYVKVAGERSWNREKAGALLGKRLRTLDELERVIDGEPAAIGIGSPAQWESAEGWASSRDELRNMVGQARVAYRDLQEQLR